jgi:hypothetical protein
MRCSECGSEKIIPEEPPVGTWVKDRFGGTHYRTKDGWAAAPTGFYAGGRWAAMWEARGPLVECAPWGVER